MQPYGFSIGGGIDQDSGASPQGFKEDAIFVTVVKENSLASTAGFRVDDKILRLNGIDFTTLCHSRAVQLIKEHESLNFEVVRKC